jgi:glycosyltransferase involved in cell wall biosynthesis
VLLSILTNRPLQVAYYQSSKYRAKVELLAKDCDLVFCHLIRTGHYALSIDLPKVLEMTDAISRNYSRIRSNSKIGGVRASLYRLEHARLVSYEKHLAGQFDLCSFVSDVDRKFVGTGKDYLSKSMVCGNGVSTTLLPFQFNYEVGDGVKRIVFIGVMSTVQNFDAAFWFAKEIMPLLAKQGNFQLDIVGRIDKQAKGRLERLDGVRVLGAVDSISSATSGALVGLCPMRIGAGVQNKVLEYMSLGLPTVTSPIGLEGLKATPGREILLASTNAEYVEGILKLATDRKYAEEIALRARRLVENEYSWEAQLRPLIQRIGKLL